MNNIQKLKKETVSGFVWSAFSRFYTIAVQFLLTLILARLLSPNVFAMIGLLNFFTLMSGIFVESGFLQSLVKEEKLTQVDCSSVFFFNVGIAVVVYIILFMCAPLIAIYFQMPELSTVSRVLFIQVILYSLSIVPRALLTREMRFKDLSLASTIAITLSAIVGIITAFWGFGVYALVIQILFLNMAELLLIWMQSKWIFIWKFSINSIKRFLTFSLYLLSTSIFVTFFNNLYTLIIGRYFSQSQLGYYSQAKRMEEVASLSITSMIVNVSYVAMAKVKDDVGLLKIAYQRVLSVNIYIVFPLMVFGVVSADNLIPFLLGDKWTASISYFRILCIYGAIFPLMSMNGNVLKVLGMGKKYLMLEIIRRGLMILFLILTIKHGIELMLWGWVVSMVISVLYSFVLCGSPINYSFSKQISDLLPFILVSLISSILPFIILKVVILPKILMLIVMSALYFSGYIIMSRFFKLQVLNDYYKYAEKGFGYIKNIIK